MKKIISANDLLLQNTIKNKIVSEICKVNDDIKEYGLFITKEDAKELVCTRNKALMKNGRVEFKETIIMEIIKKFSPSPYIMKSNYRDIFCELVEIFYEYKNETLEVLGDEELIDAMVDYFNNYCQGSIELLEGKALYKVAENVRMGLNDPFDISDEKDQ